MNLAMMQSKIAKYCFAPFSKSDYVIALILAILTLILCAGQVNSGHHWGDDFAGYIAQGIALAKGTSAQYIAENTFMWEKTDWVFGPKAYPWGFPLLLAPIYKIFGFNLVAFKSVGIICYALFVGIFYIFCANRLPKIYAIFGTLFFALNPFMIYFSANEIMSDIPFLLFGFVALIILARLFADSKISPSLADGEQRANHTQKAPPLAGGVGVGYSNANGKIDCHDSLRESRDDGISVTGGGICPYLIAIFGGIFMLFSAMIRINGLVILCALITMHGILLAKRFAPQIFKARILTPFAKVDSPYSWKIHAIPYVIFIIGFAIVSLTLSSGGSGHFSALANISPHIMLRNLSVYLQFFGTFFVVRQAEFASIEGLYVLQSLEREAFVIFLLCVPLILVGIWAILRDTKNFSENLFYCIFMVGFLVVLFVWVGFGFRLAYICLPFLVFWGAKGTMWLNNDTKKYLYGKVMSAILLCVLVYFAFGGILQKDKITRDGVYSTEAVQMWDFIDKNTPKNALIIFDKPRALYLYAHRVGFGTWNHKRLNEADFVLCYNEWDKCIGSESERMKRIYMNYNFMLFKVIK